jgi:hypothetical protein
MGQEGYSSQRVAFRFRLPCPISYSAGDASGQASLVDISAAGVRIEGATSRLQPGTRVRLNLRLGDELELTEAEAEVIRQTETGFAARFVEMDRELTLHLLNLIGEAEKSR